MAENCKIYTPDNWVGILLDEVGYKTDLYGKRVLENSCGTGNILRRIVERYITDAIAHGYSVEQIKEGLEHDIVGLEVDAKASAICKRRLTHMSKKHGIAGVKWNIVVMHESLLLPAYGAADENSLKYNHAMSLRKQLMNVFTEQQVDLVLSAQDGESFTTNPLVYDKDGLIEIIPVAGQKAGETVNEQWIKTVAVNASEAEYNGFNVSMFDDYESGEMGTVFHQVGAVGLGKTNYFQLAKMEANLDCYGGIYNRLVSGIQNGKELSMFSCIELDGNTLTLRTFGVAMNEEYNYLSELPYLGGIQLKKGME